jgi:RNA 2',3'-cyclic 3'-phosphodiesterase
MHRLFIGIKVSDLKKITLLSNELRRELSQSNINWVDPQNFHLTLKFIGDKESYYINSIKILLEEVRKQYDPFLLKFRQLDFFGSISHPRVVLWDIEKNPILCSLQQTIDKSLLELGIERESREFNPHLTIGRVKRLTEHDAFQKALDKFQILSEDIEVSEFILFESILKRTVHEYKELQVFKLKNDRDY